MKAIIVTIGDELLIGQVIDTNSAWLGAEISKLGFDIIEKISIHDRQEDILYVLNEVSGKADVVLITGGLGPTGDDITKPALCEFFHTRLVVDKEVFDMVSAMMKARNFPMNKNNRGQAEVPENCKVLKNPVGTAPGMWFEQDGTIFVSLPGVPFEMKYLMKENVLPKLKERFHSQAIIHKNIMTYGISEAQLAEKLTDFENNLPSEIKLAYLPDKGIIKLRLTCTCSNSIKAEELINRQLGNLYAVIPDVIFAEDEKNMEEVIGDLLSMKKKTVGTAESCTGGNIAHLFTTVPGSSAWYIGSVVSYSNSVKENILDVPEKFIESYGAVSQHVVESMAEGARKILKTDFAVATSGIAGPDGGTAEKPVGTVWIAVTSDKKTVSKCFNYGNDRLNNINRFTTAAMNMLLKMIIDS